MVQQLLFSLPLLFCALIVFCLPCCRRNLVPCAVRRGVFTITTGQHTWRAILALTHAVSVIKECAPHLFFPLETIELLATRDLWEAAVVFRP
jgi:hypothetical protein